MKLSFGGGVSLGKPSIHVTWPTLLKPQGAIPWTLNPLGGPRIIAWRLGRPIFRGMPTGYKVFLEPPGVSGLRPPFAGTTLKRPCAKLVRLVGRTTNRQIILTAFGGGVSLGRSYLMWMPEKPSIHVTQPTLLEPQGSNPPWRGWVYRLAPEVPLFRGMPTGTEAFLEPPVVSGPRSFSRTHLKKGRSP